jgi:hypothetical protein
MISKIIDRAAFPLTSDPKFFSDSSVNQAATDACRAR